jgi:hypothetical protein
LLTVRLNGSEAYVVGPCGAVTVTLLVVDAVAPSSSVTVSPTEYVPAD